VAGRSVRYAGLQAFKVAQSPVQHDACGGEHFKAVLVGAGGSLVFLFSFFQD
jgi:hypothetical protein